MVNAKSGRKLVTFDLRPRGTFLYFFPIQALSFECLNPATSFLVQEVHLQNIWVSFKIQGHGINVKITAAKMQQHAGLCSSQTQFITVWQPGGWTEPEILC